jgi:N-carbamoyl-D-amino-acid hydrolase
MSRLVTVGAAQMGPIARTESRKAVISRLMELMREAKSFNCDVVAFPELALTTFFPRWAIEDESELDSFYETEMPGPDTRALFVLAAELGIGFSLGYAELVIRDGVKHRFNTSILVDKTGRIAGKYRKIHLPGHAEVLDRPGQHLEKRFFEVGDLGFPVFRAFGGIMGMCICNDRRWPETYRVMGLQGVEMVLLGYNTPVGLGDPYELDALEPFHNHLVMQAGAYQNATWVVGVAKAGLRRRFQHDRADLHHRALRRDRRHVLHDGRRACRAEVRSGHGTPLPGRHLQFRRPPQAGALHAHHVQNRRHPAAMRRG